MPVTLKLSDRTDQIEVFYNNFFVFVSSDTNKIHEVARAIEKKEVETLQKFAADLQHCAYNARAEAPIYQDNDPDTAEFFGWLAERYTWAASNLGNLAIDLVS